MQSTLVREFFRGGYTPGERSDGKVSKIVEIVVVNFEFENNIPSSWCEVEFIYFTVMCDVVCEKRDPGVNDLLCI